MRGERFLAELETWIGTPFHERAAVKGAGADCKGAIYGAARDLGFPEADSFYATFLEYDLTKKDGLPHDLLREGMAALFDPVKFEDRKPGDLLLFCVNERPAHLAAYAGNDELLHAQIRSKGVFKRTKLRVLLSVSKIDSVWRWRSV